MARPTRGSSFKDLTKIARALTGATHKVLSNGARIMSWGNATDPCLFILSGVHGDERSGPVALLDELQRQDLTEWCQSQQMSLRVCAVINREGWNGNLRCWYGQDLNRVFGHPDAPDFLVELVAELERRPPSMFLDLHEDDEVDTHYLFDLVPEDTGFVQDMARDIAATVETWSMDEQEWVGSSEVVARNLGARFAVTVEACGKHPFPQRVAFQKSALRWALQHGPGYLHASTVSPTKRTTCADHTPQPEGYLHWHEWAEKMHQAGKKQIRCGECGLLSIWVDNRGIVRRRVEFNYD